MTAIQIGAYLISLAVLASTCLVPRALGGERNLDRPAFFLAALTVLFSLYPRLVLLNSTCFGLYVFEELSVLVYVKRMLLGEQTWSGATQMTYFLAMDAWRSIFGLGETAGRALSAIFGLGSIALTFLGVRNLVGARAGALAAAALSIGLYATYFSRVTIETGWTLFFFALALYLFSRRQGHFWLGLSLALGAFTYPGFVVWLVGLLPFALWSARQHRRELTMVIVGALTFALPAVAFHFYAQGEAPLFRGGGVLLESSTTYLESLAAHLWDIFVAGESYYLFFTHVTFVEASLWGFFLIGAWRLRNEAWARALFIAFTTLPFLSALATNYPGMRRGILFLGTFYVFAGAGMDEFLTRLSRSRIWLPGLALLIAALALPAFVLVDGLRQAERAVPYDAYSELIQHPDFPTWLRAGKVRAVIDNDDQFARDYLIAFTHLLDRYHRPRFGYSANFSVSIKNVIPGERETWILTKEEYIRKVTESGKACVWNVRKVDTRYFPLWSAEVERRGLAPCPPY